METRSDARFAERVRTRIWQEEPQADNPWAAAAARCHGYALEEMVARLPYCDTLFLLLKGELPTPAQSALLQRFLVAFCNPGPRHAATRAVMTAAASGTRSANLPAIGLALLGADHLGSGEVESAARFIRASLARDPAAVAEAARAATTTDADGESRAAPGFGTLYGTRDAVAATLAATLIDTTPDAPALDWSHRFVAALADTACGWLMPGLAAAVATDLGFTPRPAGLLFQLAGLPGLIAHGIEASGRGIGSMPFLRDEDYVLLDTAQPEPAAT